MKISKNKHIIDVSPDTYKIMYKRLGYEPVIEKKAEVKPKIEEVKPKEENKNDKK